MSNIKPESTIIKMMADVTATNRNFRSVRLTL
ncbi:MAG: hypothetical protein NBKEAIPA_03393 [Nitrospirae bacterium]|nr:hypothetical protein [Nitrospirota bacterium]